MNEFEHKNSTIDETARFSQFAEKSRQIVENGGSVTWTIFVNLMYRGVGLTRTVLIRTVFRKKL